MYFYNFFLSHDVYELSVLYNFMSLCFILDTSQYQIYQIIDKPQQFEVDIKYSMKRKTLSHFLLKKTNLLPVLKYEGKGLYSATCHPATITIYLYTCSTRVLEFHGNYKKVIRLSPEDKYFRHLRNNISYKITICYNEFSTTLTITKQLVLALFIHQLSMILLSRLE